MSSNGENAATTTSRPVFAPTVRYLLACETPLPSIPSPHPVCVAEPAQSSQLQSLEQPCALLRAGHRARADTVACVPSGAPSRGIQPQRAAPAWAGAVRPGPQYVEPTRPGVRRTPATCPSQHWPDPPRAGQHRPGAVRPGRVERCQARGRAPRSWRKLHLAVDADTGEIAAHVLTDGHADDAAQVPALLGQAEG
jgi:hypothetical protein